MSATPGRVPFARERTRPLFLGMIHLRPLPGSPRWSGSVPEVAQAAVEDLAALQSGGADGAIIENFFDAPFYPGPVPPVTIAAMTAVAALLKAHASDDFLLGINVLRNDATASLSIAAVVGASFVRVNVHIGAAVSDQGILHGSAHDTLRLRATLGASVSILADVRVKHAHPLGDRSIAEEAADVYERGLADGLLVTGSRTGAASDEADLLAVRAAVPEASLLAASGIDPVAAERAASLCDGVIVGTWLKEGARIDAPVDLERVKQIRSALARGCAGRLPQ